MSSLIAWMTRNRVAANLLMLVLLIGGLLSMLQTKQEVFPQFDMEAISISVSLPGASPEEVEQGVLLALEDAVSGLEGVDEITSNAREASGTVTIQLLSGTDMDDALSDVRAAVNAVSTLPAEAETPTVAEVSRRQRVLSVLVSGDQDPRDLKAVADELRDAIVQQDGVSVAEVEGLPDREVAIEVTSETLRRYDLTLDDIASQIASTSLERGAGTLETNEGDLSVRVTDRRVSETDLANIPVRTAASGAVVRLGDIATIVDGYEDATDGLWVDGRRAIRIEAYRTGDETPAAVSEATRTAVAAYQAELPDTVQLDIIRDESEILQGRLDLLLSNAFSGLLLVLAVLALFLDLRTAVWVAVGIPVSFLGAFLLMPAMGVTVNMISLFAFLVVLGLVVDDAIVVGEQVFHEREQGGKPVAAAISGARRMVGPVVVALLTTVFAFAPMMGVPGTFGKIFAVFPIVIGAVLFMSFVESFLILPAHLSHGGGGKLWRITDPVRERFAGLLQRFIDGVYRPVLDRALTWRPMAVALGLASAVLTGGLVAGGFVPVQFFPEISGETITATATLPVGAPESVADEVRVELERSARAAAANTDSTEAQEALVARVNEGTTGGDEVTVQLSFEATLFDAGADAVRAAWEDAVGTLPVGTTLAFRSSMGPDAGGVVHVGLSHNDRTVLEAASEDLMASLAELSDLANIESTAVTGTPSVELRLSALGESLGLSTDSLSSQVRSAYQGAQALREQDGRDERTLQVRLPESERVSLTQVLDLPIRVAEDAYVPLSDVAEVTLGSTPAVIQREDGRRNISVTADLAPGIASAPDAVALAHGELLTELESRYPGLSTHVGGQAEEQSESMSSLLALGGMALLGIYALLAATFRSYLQPIVVMTAIPFGIVGAALGHFAVGVPLSLISVFGIVALSGVVVNDSLVLVDAANEYRAQGMSAEQAIREAGARRFRPILLTSLTTFLGLAPMILETSIEAQFLIPMAVSLGFGILFATLIVLLLVPVFYLQVEGLRAWLGTDHEDDEDTVSSALPAPAK